jgi:hypothetical protein
LSEFRHYALIVLYLALGLAIMFPPALPARVAADPVVYYLYANPVPDELMQEYQRGPAGKDIVCISNEVCGIRADIVLGGDEEPQDKFADWRTCMDYARGLATDNLPGYKFFCLGTDNRAFW